MTEFDGEIEFGKADADTVVNSNDTTPSPDPKPDSAPLFDTPQDAEPSPADEALTAEEVAAEEAGTPSTKKAKGGK